MKVSVLVGTVKGGFLFRSDENRKKWTVEGPLFKGWKVTAATRASDGKYVAATANFVYGLAIHRSPDLVEWTQVPCSPELPEGQDFKLNEVWTMTAADNRVYAGVDEAAMFESEDQGEHWSFAPGLTNHPSRDKWFPGFGGLCAHSLLVDPKNHDRLWCGISAVGVFRSEDRGESWSCKNEGIPMIIEDQEHKDIGFCVHAIAQDPDDPQLMYRQDHKGMFRSKNGGDLWEKNEEGLPSGFGFPLAQDHTTKALFAVPLQSDEYRMPIDGALKVYRSQDGGDSWQGMSKGLPQEHAYMGVLRKAMAVDHLDPCGVFIGTTAGTVHYSADGGDTWGDLPGVFPRILTVQAFVED